MIDVTTPNPFIVPGMEDTPNHPLCPWKAPVPDAEVDHTDYYCDVGGHEEAHSRFTTWASTPARLCDKGAVVVVGGPTGSGKTSLLHRCVHWIHKNMHMAESPVHVFDFTAASSRGLSVDERARKVVNTARIKLFSLQPPPWILDVLKSGDVTEIELVLELMAGMHNTDDVRHSFIVILPRQEDDTAWDEAKKYCDWVNQGVVFFMENATSHAPPEFEAHANASIFLSLRHLTEDEPFKFIQKWPGASSASPSIPEEAMTRLHQYLHRLKGRLTTRVLVATLREVFAERIARTSEYQRLDYVTQQEAVDMMVKVLYQSGLGDAAR